MLLLRAPFGAEEGSQSLPKNSNRVPPLSPRCKALQIVSSRPSHRATRPCRSWNIVLLLILASLCACDRVTTTEPVLCPADMVLISGGTYLLGQTTDVPSWPGAGEAPLPPNGYWSRPNPARPTSVSPFCIDVYEFPNQAGRAPRTEVSWNEASTLCQRQGKRLLTRLEWQAAAQGKKGSLFSYGLSYEPGRCNTGQDVGHSDKIVKSGSFPRCHSPEGVFDLDGNVSEWVEDDWEGPWDGNDIWGGPEDQTKTVMGGTAWRGDMYGQDATSRHRHPRSQRWKDDGFRCAKDPVNSAK